MLHSLQLVVVLTKKTNRVQNYTDHINDTPPCNYYGNNFNYIGFDGIVQTIASCAPLNNCNNAQYCITPTPEPSTIFPKENYMSYNFGCMNQFTSGQKNWMQSSIDFFRSNLVSTPNLYATGCLLYTSPSPRDSFRSRMPSSA